MISKLGLCLDHFRCESSILPVDHGLTRWGLFTLSNHFTKARTYPDSIVFEVCPAAAGECNHSEPRDHREYVFPQRAELESPEDRNMNYDDALREVRLLEALISAPPIKPLTVHDEEGISV